MGLGGVPHALKDPFMLQERDNGGRRLGGLWWW